MFLTVFTQATTCDHQPDRFNCVKFIKNYDGDTITIDIPQVHPFFGKKAKIRLIGIDTPELRPKGEANPCEAEWGKVAKKFVENELSSAKRIDLTDVKSLDKYGRILTTLIYDDKNLNKLMIKNYLAVPYYGEKKPKVNWCEMMEKRKNEGKKL